MGDVPTLHIRNVPPELYERLREIAEAHSRSLNNEVIELLEQAVADEREEGQWIREFDELAKRMKLPPGAPKPEDIIREFRDAGGRP